MCFLRESQLDHLVYATPELEATCRDLEIRLGVRASAGSPALVAIFENAIELR